MTVSGPREISPGWQKKGERISKIREREKEGRKEGKSSENKKSLLLVVQSYLFC